MNEDQKFLKPRNYGSSYGSITKNSKVLSTKPLFVEHKVKLNDTLISLAIQYETTVEDLKRLNNVWSNESLQIKGKVKIPTFQKVSNTVNANISLDLEEFISSDSVSDKSDSSQKDLSISYSQKKSSAKVKSVPRSHTFSSERDLSEMNAAEFLQKYDFQIMKLKSNVEKLETESSLSEEDNAYSQLPKRTSKFLNRRPYRPHDQLLDQDDPLNSPELVVKSKRKGNDDNNSGSHDDFYNL